MTGDERLMADVLKPEMQRLDLAPRCEDFLPGRPNVYGARMGNGPHLTFIGHTDVVHARTWATAWEGKAQEDPFGATIIDGELWGRGAADLKAGICTTLMALDVIDRAGIKLEGSLSYAFVGDEESGEPDTGVSAGIKTYVRQVQAGMMPKPDFCIYTEPTKLAIYPVQMGFFIADITITGRSAYFGKPELGVDALKAAHRVLTAIWKHSDEVSARASHPLLGPGFALVTDLKAGGLIAVPGEAKISLIRKLLPGETIDGAIKELESAIHGVVPKNIGLSILYPAGRDHARGGSPAGIDGERQEIRLLAQCIGAVKPGSGRIEGAPFWSEMPFITEQLKAPAVYFAPGDISICHTNEERVPLKDYHDAIVGLAAFIVSYCNPVTI
ncbi:M20 family metallopeptidase [Aestuariivirga litoralis]|uniref:M20 family metallopeptidase n=1 Tax=Aestuariivirga litoralis TaxID=2650924 RepID=UPI0032B16B48